MHYASPAFLPEPREDSKCQVQKAELVFSLLEPTAIWFHAPPKTDRCHLPQCIPVKKK